MTCNITSLEPLLAQHNYLAVNRLILLRTFGFCWGSRAANKIEIESERLEDLITFESTFIRVNYITPAQY
jgi:hypothetical protein